MRVAGIGSLTLITTLAAWTAHAHGPEAKATGPDGPVVEAELVVAGAPDAGPGGEDHTVAFVWAQESFERAVVRGQPYAADAVTEIVQTLADGNRIVRKTTASVARDGVGRTRREHALGAVGPLVAAEAAPRMVFLNDPVVGAAYVLDLDARTAFRHRPGERAHAPGADEEVEAIAPPPGPGLHGPHPPRAGMRVERHRLPKGASESLGKQMIEGVEAEGTRTTATIPAGEIGNERPIQVVSERWFSPDLQVVVLSRHSDPRFGETTYRLTHLSRAEPAAPLFEVPADFTVKDGPPGPFMRRREVIRERREPK